MKPGISLQWIGMCVAKVTEDHTDGVVITSHGISVKSFSIKSTMFSSRGWVSQVLAPTQYVSVTSLRKSEKNLCLIWKPGVQFQMDFLEDASFLTGGLDQVLSLHCDCYREYSRHKKEEVRRGSDFPAFPSRENNCSLVVCTHFLTNVTSVCSVAESIQLTSAWLTSGKDHLVELHWPFSWENQSYSPSFSLLTESKEYKLEKMCPGFLRFFKCVCRCF